MTSSKPGFWFSVLNNIGVGGRKEKKNKFRLLCLLNKALSEQSDALFDVFSPLCSEENVWKLCEQIRDEKEQNLSEYYSVFISNEKRQVSLQLGI